MRIASNTLVKNGMPFIEPVLRNVIPYMNRCLITISEKSNDGTRQVLEKLRLEYPDKIVIFTENVPVLWNLTQERQKLLENTYEDWVLFLDDDDWWSKTSLEAIKQIIEDNPEGLDALCSPVYQLIDRNNYDWFWRKRLFTKFFKNQEGLVYRRPFPRDLIYLNDTPLFWKKTRGVEKVPYWFIHLSNLKKYSFRKDEAFTKYFGGDGIPDPLPKWMKAEVERIYKWLS